MNIMLNDVCNLKCPYCFANQYVNGDTSTEITVENFKKAVDFNNRSRDRIGIIGGEPTLHSKFTELLDYAVEKRCEDQEIIVFTNGIKMEEYINYFAKNDITILVNVNSPLDIGEKNYNIVRENIKKARMKGVDISVGINFYKGDLDTKFIKDIVEECSFKHLRVGITSPNSKEKIKAGAMAYYKEILEPMMDLIRDMASLGCGVGFDCQKIPKCVLMEHIEELEYLQRIVPTLSVLEHMKCNPVLDILTDLRVVRCFGMSGEGCSVKMEDFTNPEDISSFFTTKVDALANLYPASDICTKCYDQLTGDCQGSCLTYRKEELINKASSIVNGKFNKA